jgi:class III poly(R)-hydroxyalkanoic acid synthase PhaE subunit
MSDNKQKTDELNWAEFQKQYFDALSFFNASPSFTGINNPFAASGNPFAGNNNPFTGSKPMNNPFMNSGMDQWWNSMNKGAGSSQANENIFEKLAEQSRFYYFMTEQFSNLFDGLSNFKGENEDVADFINKKFLNLKDMFSQAPENMSWSGFIDPYEKPFQAMKDSASNSMFNFSNLFQGVQPEMQKMRDQFLSMPGVGQNREVQEKLQKLIKLAAIYQDHNNEKQIEMARLSQDALELMREEILRMSKDGEEFTSMRQVYDLWIESNEKVYSDFVYSEKYSELNGRVVNSQMAYMKLSHEVNEDILTAMNMPTNKALNELERRHYELRKRVKTLETELKNLKSKETKESKVSVNKPVLAKGRTEAVVSKAAKKKTSKKKVAKKTAVKKRVPEKTVAKKKDKSAVKKAKSKSASSKSNVKNNVIELRF